MRVHRMNQHAVVLDNLLTGFRWAVPQGVPLIVGDTGDQDLTSRVIREHDVDAIIHFAASLIVPDSVRAPLTYYRNNTVNSQALIECAVNSGVRHFIFSSTAAVYGNPQRSRSQRMRLKFRAFLALGLAPRHLVRGSEQ